MLLDILRDAVFVEEVENTATAKPRIKSYTIYTSAVRINGAVRPVRIKVDNVIDESRGAGYYYHQVEEVSVEAPVGDPRRLSQQDVGLPEASTGEISVGRLLGIGDAI